jgi:D-alanyl-D-alanine carboxypeptidase
MQRAWRVLELVISLIIVLILFTIAYFIFNPTTPTVSVLPTLEPLPTFGIAPEVQQRIDTVANTSYARFQCAEHTEVGPVLLATCVDCMYYAVDKLHALMDTYVPPLVETKLAGGGKMRPEVDAALTALFAAAQQQGFTPVVTSAYRSFTEQVYTFQSWIAFEKQRQATDAQAIERAARYSARAGHSEHQLGTAIDINCSGCTAFDTNDARNIALWAFFEQHAHEYGFAISYPRGIEALTGYQYEPWHLRYIGVELATQLYQTGYVTGNGVCLTNFLRVQLAAQ